MTDPSHREEGGTQPTRAHPYIAGPPLFAGGTRRAIPLAADSRVLDGLAPDGIDEDDAAADVTSGAGDQDHAALPLALLAHYLGRVSDGADVTIAMATTLPSEPTSVRTASRAWRTVPLTIDDAASPMVAHRAARSALSALDSFGQAGATEAAAHSRAMAGVALLPMIDGAPDDALSNADPPLVLLRSQRDERWWLSFSTDRVSESNARRIAGHLETLARNAAAAPDRPLGELDFLTAGEREQLLKGWNDTRAAYDRSATVHGLIARAAAEAPDAVAVTGRDRSLSYAELLDASGRWAEVLRGRGVGPDVLVGIRMHRTPEMAIAILAVLQAGGAYVPIDPAWPVERARFVASDAQLALLLTSRELAGDLAPNGVAPASLLVLEGLPELPDPIGGVAEERRDAAPENLAYVIYTSGSTGTPKGVLVEHRGVVNYLSWCIDAYELDVGHGAPVHSSLAFDLTVTSLLAPLAAGRTVVFVHDEEALDGLADALRRRPFFSLVKLTPAHLDVLRAQLAPEEAAVATRRFVVGGEALHARSLDFWRQCAPETVIVNEYGPTETVVGCCVHAIRADDLVPDLVPIGRPIANTQLHVLDGAQRLLPVGVPGELYIGGDGVARGYLRRPELTAERFVPDPFAERAHGGTPSRDAGRRRLYRTGDRVRRLEDGTLEFLGRLDDQVKVQGHRIELGEVEHALRSHPAVSDAAVAAREVVPGDVRLVAWLVAAGGSTPPFDELGDWLGDRLPAYMVPARWTWLPALPLTPNGKVDRSALSTPPDRHGASVAPVAAEGELEQRLLAVWREVLGRPVGVQDDFFASGGSSLLAARMVGLAAERIGAARITFGMLLDAPTVRGLAERLARGVAAPESSVVQLNEGRQGVPPLFYFHGASGFYMVPVARHLHPEQPFYLVHPVHPDGPKTIEEMAELRLRQLREIRPHGPYHLAGTCNGAALAYAAACRLRDEGEEVGLLALVNAHDRTAGLAPFRRAVHAAARMLRLDAERETDLWLRVRDRAATMMPHLPYAGPGSSFAERARFLLALPFHAARIVAQRLRRRTPTASPVRLGADEDPLAAPSSDAARRYEIMDAALRSWFPRRYDGTATLIFWEQSFARRDGDNIHGRDATRGWARHCAEVRIRDIPGLGDDLDTRDKRALARELDALLREEHARYGVVLRDGDPDSQGGRRRGAAA